mmetsp:Transcript_42370/g.132839  ORF Transcript_42370/g.132839 Transcript_42370/m.132839 type:complete len:296 (+) Transcript_42370:3511-4398(+)
MAVAVLPRVPSPAHAAVDPEVPAHRVRRGAEPLARRAREHLSRLPPHPRQDVGQEGTAALEEALHVRSRAGRAHIKALLRSPPGHAAEALLHQRTGPGDASRAREHRRPRPCLQRPPAAREDRAPGRRGRARGAAEVHIGVPAHGRVPRTLRGLDGQAHRLRGLREHAHVRGGREVPRRAGRNPQRALLDGAGGPVAGVAEQQHDLPRRPELQRQKQRVQQQRGGDVGGALAPLYVEQHGLLAIRAHAGGVGFEGGLRRHRGRPRRRSQGQRRPLAGLVVGEDGAAPALVQLRRR